MRRRLLVVAALILTFGVGVTASLSFVDAKSADPLKCSALAGCSGSAGCSFGAATNCEINCSDGNVVLCNSE